MRALVTRVLSGAGLIGLAACGGGGDSTAPPPPPPPAVASVAVAPSTPTLVVAQTVQLTATVKDGSGNALSGHTVTWSTGDPTVASVSDAGLATAVGVGTATITATSEGKSGTATVTVQAGSMVGASGGEVTALGGKVTLEIPAQALSATTAISVTPVTAPPSQAGLVAGTAYEFGPSGTQFAQPVTIKIQYDPAGLTAQADPAQFRIHRWNGTAWQALAGSTSDPGTHTVTGQTTSFSTYAVIEVPAPVASIELNQTQVDLPVGGTFQLSATLEDGAGKTLTGRTITWTSSAPAVATVSETGLVTGIAAGPATIQASSEGVTAQASVTVLPPVSLAEQRVLAQQGLAIALASTVLQSQLDVLFIATEGEETPCTQALGGGSYRSLPVGSNTPTRAGIYFGDDCTRPYIIVDFVQAPNTPAGTTTLSGTAAYTGPTGTPLGTLTVEETANISFGGQSFVHGLGLFTPLNGKPPVHLGLTCSLVAGGSTVPCQGGIMQDFPELSVALGSVTSIDLTVPDDQSITFEGNAILTSGPVGSLTLTAPTNTTLAVQGGSPFGTSSAVGGAATFSLFPPTPTGWTVTDQEHDQRFTISVVSNTERNLVGSIVQISTGKTLATLALDQSGTGTITYSDGSVVPVTSWLLGG